MARKSPHIEVDLFFVEVCRYVSMDFLCLMLYYVFGMYVKEIWKEKQGEYSGNNCISGTHVTVNRNKGIFFLIQYYSI